MRVRQLWKDALWWFNVRTLYSKITLTRFTTVYFILALANCIVQIILQVAIFSENAQGIQTTSTILAEAKIPQGIPIIQDHSLQICDSIPGQDGTHCIVVSGKLLQNSTFSLKTRDGQHQAKAVGGRALTGEAQFDPSGHLQGVTISDGPSAPQTLSDQCVVSLSWLNDILQNARSEDAVTLAFQIWLLGLSLVTILNESIPHLFAVLASHVLDTIWAGFRVKSTSGTTSLYHKFVVRDACNGVDINKTLWDARMSNAIAIVTVNCVACLGVFYLTLNLFKVYKTQTAKLVGTSTQVNTVYKLVLTLSVSLQLAGFFIFASTAIWIDKVSSGAISHVAIHLSLYRVAFVVTTILGIPWLVLGWISVRREKRNLFAAFTILGLILVVVSSAMFASALYRFVFDTWSFFATITVFAYILLVLTSILGILCRVKFGNGLTAYLTVGERTEDLSFDPVHLANWEKSVPDEPVPLFFKMDPEKNPYQEIATPAPAIIKENESSSIKVKSMLRRLSSQPRRLAVTFANTTQGIAPEPKIPSSPAETLDNIVLSYGSVNPGGPHYTTRPRSDASQLEPTPSPMSPSTPSISRFGRSQIRATSRWSMSTAADDATHIDLPFNARHPAKNVKAGLPSNPRLTN